jgi:hypothetical protein
MTTNASRKRLVSLGLIGVVIVVVALGLMLPGLRADRNEGPVPDSGDWWEAYPLCPGEEGDRAGFGEVGGNDKWHTGDGDRIPVPHECVGWIHWARGYWDGGETSDQDHYYFVPGAAASDIVVTLTQLPADYQLVAYIPPAVVGGVSRQGDTLVSSHLGADDEMLVIQSPSPALHTIIVYSQVLAGGGVDFDAEQPYLLSITEQSKGMMP